MAKKAANATTVRTGKAPERKTPDIMSKKNIILVLLVVLSVITFLDRTCITFASMEIKEDLGIDQSGWGWVMSIFTLSYGLMQIPLGALGDKVGHRWVLALIVLWWSLFTGFTGMAGGLMSMLAIRFCFGIGEAGASPCSTSVISRWFEKEKVGKAQGFVWAATRLGGAAAPFLVIPLVANHGWRFSFYLLGGIGAIWALVWVYTYRDKTHPHRTVRERLHQANEKVHIGARQAKQAKKIIKEKRKDIPWRDIASHRQFWIICGMYFFYAFGSWFFFTWFPEFMKQGRGFAAEEIEVCCGYTFHYEHVRQHRRRLPHGQAYGTFRHKGGQESPWHSVPCGVCRVHGTRGVHTGKDGGICVSVALFRHFRPHAPVGMGTVH